MTTTVNMPRALLINALTLTAQSLDRGMRKATNPQIRELLRIDLALIETEIQELKKMEYTN